MSSPYPEHIVKMTSDATAEDNRKVFNEWAGKYDQVSIKEALSVLMLCTPSNCRWPFSYHMKIADFKYLFSFVRFPMKKMA